MSDNTAANSGGEHPNSEAKSDFNASQVRYVLHELLTKSDQGEGQQTRLDDIISAALARTPTSIWGKIATLFGRNGAKTVQKVSDENVASFKCAFVLTFNQRYMAKSRNNDLFTNAQADHNLISEDSWTTKLLNYAKYILYGLDFLLFSVGSLAYFYWRDHHKKKNVDADVATGTGNKRTRRSIGEYMTGYHAKKLALALQEKAKDYQPEQVLPEKISDADYEVMADGFDKYQPRKQAVLQKIGQILSLSYGVGTAVLVFFYIFMLTLNPWILIPILVVCCAGNFAVNTYFSMNFMPKVILWIFGQGDLLEGMCTSEDKDGKWTQAQGFERATVKAGILLSFASAIAMGALTYFALLGTLAALMSPPGAMAVAAVIGVITILFMTMLFTNFWVTLANRGGFWKFIIGTLDDMTEGMAPNSPKYIITWVFFVVNFVICSVGFGAMVIICMGPLNKIITPLGTYIGLAPGIFAQLPNIFSFCATMSRKIVLLIEQRYVPAVKALALRLARGNAHAKQVMYVPAAIAIVVFEVVKTALILISVVMLFIPLMIGKVLSSFIELGIGQERPVKGGEEAHGDTAPLIPNEFASKRSSKLNLSKWITKKFFDSPSFLATVANPFVSFVKAILVLPLVPFVGLSDLLAYFERQVKNGNDKMPDDDKKGKIKTTVVPPVVLHVLLVVEVTSNALAYAVAIGSSAILTFCTTFWFTYMQRGDTQIVEKSIEGPRIKEICSEAWLTAHTNASVPGEEGEEEEYNLSPGASGPVDNPAMTTA